MERIVSKPLHRCKTIENIWLGEPDCNGKDRAKIHEELCDTCRDEYNWPPTEVVCASERAESLQDIIHAKPGFINLCCSCLRHWRYWSCKKSFGTNRWKHTWFQSWYQLYARVSFDWYCHSALQRWNSYMVGRAMEHSSSLLSTVYDRICDLCDSPIDSSVPKSQHQLP